MLCEQYIDIPGYHLLTLWLCYVGAYVVLTCGLAACSLNGPGGAKDGYDDKQPMLLFKFEYMSTLLKVSDEMITDVTIHILFPESFGSIEGQERPPTGFGFIVHRNNRGQRTSVPVWASLVSILGRFVIGSRIGNFIDFALPTWSVGFVYVDAPRNSTAPHEHSSQWNLSFTLSSLFLLFLLIRISLMKIKDLLLLLLFFSLSLYFDDWVNLQLFVVLLAVVVILLLVTNSIRCTCLSVVGNPLIQIVIGHWQFFFFGIYQCNN